MSDIVSLPVQTRELTGTKAAKKLRKTGFIPGVIYGHKEAVVQIALPVKELDHAIRMKHARTLSLTINGKTETCLIRELQWDHLGKEMVHIDLLRTNLSEKVRVKVPVELKGAPKTLSGGVLDQPMHEVHIECAASDIPDAIKVDVNELTLGQPIHIRDLQLPKGVTVTDGPEMVVVHIKIAGAEPVVEGSAAEPEILSTKKPKDEEE